MMRGEEWERLVSAPTATEVDAALAGVRVRALDVVRRQARTKRVVNLALLSVVLTGGVMVGREFRSGERAPAWAPVTYGHAPLAPAATVPAGVFRYRITTWAELHGERMSFGEAWVEGPPGTSFQITKWMPPFSYTALFAVGDSGEITARSEVRRSERSAGGSWRSTEERWPVVRENFSAGALLVYPFGEAVMNDEPVLTIRIDGPRAGMPADGIPWRLPRAGSWTGELDHGAARAAGVRYALRSEGPFTIQTGYAPLIRRFRFTLEGHEPSSIYTIYPDARRGPGMPGMPVFIPGFGDTVGVILEQPNAAQVACFSFAVEAGNTDQAAGCFPAADPSLPLVIRTREGRRLTVELIR